MNALKMSVAVSAVLAVCVSTAAVAKPTLLPPDAPPLVANVTPPVLETPTSAIVLMSLGGATAVAGALLTALNPPDFLSLLFLNYVRGPFISVGFVFGAMLFVVGAALFGAGVTTAGRHRGTFQQPPPPTNVVLAVHRRALETARASEVAEATCAETTTANASTPLTQQDGPEAPQLAPAAG